MIVIGNAEPLRIRIYDEDLVGMSEEEIDCYIQNTVEQVMMEQAQFTWYKADQ